MQDNVISLLQESNLEALLAINLDLEEWIWINEEIYIDLISNVIKEDLENLYLDNRWKELVLDIIRKKMQERGWVEVSQILFQIIDESFKPTKDIETYIFMKRKYYIKEMNRIADEYHWIFKAMAIDAVQHLIPEEGNLQQLYESYFKDNFMILEELMVKGYHKLHQGKWLYDKKTNLLRFIKKEREHRQWAEGNTNAIFKELSM